LGAALSRNDVLTIDPVGMGITNRVAAGCELECNGDFRGGLLVQGKLSGKLRVLGPLVVWEGAQLGGEIEVFGDTYAFGQLGSDVRGGAIAAPETQVVCHGAIFMSHSAVSHASIAAQRIHSYDGAQIHGPFRTLKNHKKLPELKP
jgi:cytoskeletal protein CcmA (bactofilin family)